MSMGGLCICVPRRTCISCAATERRFFSNSSSRAASERTGSTDPMSATSLGTSSLARAWCRVVGFRWWVHGIDVSWLHAAHCLYWLEGRALARLVAASVIGFMYATMTIRSSLFSSEQSNSAVSSSTALEPAKLSRS